MRSLYVSDEIWILPKNTRRSMSMRSALSEREI